MCELLGMSANVPTDICFSLTGLIQRGGKTGPHKDGWGITFYEGKGIRVFRDPSAGVHSEIAKLVKNYPIKSPLVIAHIRRASQGKVCLENTHPFNRELWGRNWTFAHNGNLKGVKGRPLSLFRPVGSTDSEYAFCWILDQVQRRFPDPPPVKEDLMRFIKGLLDDLHMLGRFNVLLCDGEFLYAYCSTKLTWLTRKAPFGRASLVDMDWHIDFKEKATATDVVTVIATRPLTRNEEWTTMRKGELLVFKDGVSQAF